MIEGQALAIDIIWHSDRGASTTAHREFFDALFRLHKVGRLFRKLQVCHLPLQSSAQELRAHAITSQLDINQCQHKILVILQCRFHRGLHPIGLLDSPGKFFQYW